MANDSQSTATKGGIVTTLRAALSAGLLAGLMLGIADGVAAGVRTHTRGVIAWLGCLASSLSASSTKQVKVVVTGKQQLTYPSIADRTAAYRVSLVLKASVKVRKRIRKLAVRATFDFIAVGNGRATAMMWALSFKRQPLSDFSKQQWALLMVQRMALDPSAPK